MHLGHSVFKEERAHLETLLMVVKRAQQLESQGARTNCAALDGSQLAQLTAGSGWFNGSVGRLVWLVASKTSRSGRRNVTHLARSTSVGAPT